MSESLRGASSRAASYGSFAIESRSAWTTESGRRSRSATKAIHRPSGETTAFRCEYAVFVIMTFVVSPTIWIQSCAGRYSRASLRLGMKPRPFALYGKSTMCMPSNRRGSSGWVIEPYGGLAIGGIAANGSFVLESAESRSSSGRGAGCVKTAKRLSRGMEPVGYVSIWTASPAGRSMRSAHVDPLPPGRLELKKRYAPSGDQRGFELSVPGEVTRYGSPPSVGTTQISEWRRFSDSLTVVTVKAT